MEACRTGRSGASVPFQLSELASCPAIERSARSQPSPGRTGHQGRAGRRGAVIPGSCCRRRWQASASRRRPLRSGATGYAAVRQRCCLPQVLPPVSLSDGADLGDPGLERPARAGRRDVPTGLARGSGPGNSRRPGAGARAAGPVRQEADPGPWQGAGVCLRPSRAVRAIPVAGNRSPALRIMTVSVTGLLRRGAHGAPRQVRGCPERALRGRLRRGRCHGRAGTVRGRG